jgi:hypothetical protein
MFQYHWKKSTRVSKNAEVDADFEFVEKFAKNITQKVIGRNLLHIIINVKKYIFKWI